MNVAKTFGARMKQYRTARGLTQAALAELLELSEQTVWYYESGSHWPKADVIGLIAKTLRVRPWQLLAEDGDGLSVPPDVADLAGQLARRCGLKVVRP